jgi:hypothetical protein
MRLLLLLNFEWNCHPFWYTSSDGLLNVNPTDVLDDGPVLRNLLDIDKRYQDSYDKKDPLSSGGITTELYTEIMQFIPLLKEALRKKGYNLEVKVTNESS